MCSYFPFISGGWQGALSRNKITFVCFLANFRFSLDSTASRMLKSIQDLAWLKYEQGSWDLPLIALKQSGLFDFPITIGSLSSLKRLTQILSDASFSGWGACLKLPGEAPVEARGHWVETSREYHIAAKETQGPFQRCSVPSCPVLQRQSRRLHGQQTTSG